ncbi:DUF2914 domain-containing protein [Fodinibius salsisoli]|uniref:DUF2914 domain-containing protein n=1 Tax=Fodinibius salsisoli TaxID=2820877 RepID=A0ABT3PNH4_9BACT|nr:DUF2914 domain-containing protein [Fodinibius salsisoli]MCW9707405.1 DUF2914 domain-containing protein [Fodinibius salsisoli]
MVSSIKSFLNRHKRYAPVIFFIGGFTWDSLTLGRIDGWYSNTVLFTYLGCLTVCLYIFNLADDNYWEDTFLKEYEDYAPLAIQFFLGGLSSAYVIFFFQSVSLTKTAVFFLILVALLISNEFLKHRISNKYLQFGAYFFVTFTFFTFFVPIVAGMMNTTIFIISGLLGLGCTMILIFYLYFKSPSTRAEITGWKISILIIGIYLFINGCYYFNLIPPVPMSLETGTVAYHVEKSDSTFNVTYEKPHGFSRLWKPHDHTFNYSRGDSIFIYTSIFAPTDLQKSINHTWQWYDSSSGSWQTSDVIAYEIVGGRRGGYRGFTYKTNATPGKWRVNVTTSEGLVLGELNFKIVADSSFDRSQLITKQFN